MKTKLGSILIAFLLLGVLTLPTANQWIHLSEGHHLEEHCTESSTHFHKKELACELIATFTSPYAPYWFQPTEYFVNSPKKELIQSSFENLIYGHTTTLYLRGPPDLLFFV